MESLTEPKSDSIVSTFFSEKVTVSENKGRHALEEQCCEHDLSNRRLDYLEKQIIINNVAYLRLTERIFRIENQNKTNLSETNSPTLIETPIIDHSYVSRLFQTTSLLGMNNVTKEGISFLHSLIWVLIHTVALLISSSYILGAYHSWQNSLIVQSLVYTDIKDVPFPAITICEPLLLKDDYNRFDILKRCMSLKTEATWLCTKEELIKFQISDDIYPIEYDLIPINETNRIIMRKLFSPIFNSTPSYFSGILNRTFSGIEYFKHLNELGKQCVSKIHIYNSDMPENKYRTINLHSLISNPIFMARRQDNEDGIHICQTFNGKKYDLWENMNEGVSQNTPIHFKTKQLTCNPSSIMDGVCKASLLFTDNHLDIVFDDASNVDSIEPVNEDFSTEMEFLQEAQQSFQRHIVLVHSSFDHPSITTMNYQTISKATTSVSTYSTSFINTVAELADVDVSKRNCIFSYEMKLSLFELYTQKNCMFECQINCTISLCGCIPYKTAIFKSPFRVCSNRKSDECISKSKFFYWSEFKDQRCACNCPLDCVSLSYKTRLTYEGIPPNQNTTYQIASGNDAPLMMVRHSLSSLAEFVAYCLGILGVFNGFSMVLVWEILYGLTVGLWSTIRKLH